jgi:hypothetical protein
MVAFRSVVSVLLWALGDVSLHPQGRPCGRPPAALRPGNNTTVTGAPASPSTRGGTTPSGRSGGTAPTGSRPATSPPAGSYPAEPSAIEALTAAIQSESARRKRSASARSFAA